MLKTLSGKSRKMETLRKNKKRNVRKKNLTETKIPLDAISGLNMAMEKHL